MPTKKASKKPSKPTGSAKKAPAGNARKAPAGKPQPAAPKAGAKKAATPATKAPPAPRKKASPPAAAPAPEAPYAPVEDPDFVRRASPADRKAALQAILDREGLEETLPHAPAPPPAAAAPPPAFVRETPAHDRKAAVEQLVQESGVAGALAKAPWKRQAPAPPAAPPAPAEPVRTSPRLAMTKAPIEPVAGRSPPKVVILDSNALMMQFQFHVDIEKEVRRLLSFNFDVVVPSVVVEELQRLAKEGNQKEAGEARMALELAKTFRIEETPADVADALDAAGRRRGVGGDTAILRLAERLNAIVVTNDKVLRARLRAKDIPNIYMRSRAFLTIEGHIPGM